MQTFSIETSNVTELRLIDWRKKRQQTKQQQKQTKQQQQHQQKITANYHSNLPV